MANYTSKICFAKIETLTQIFCDKKVTANSLSKDLYEERTAISHRLSRYYDQELLKREKKGKEFIYELTDWGLEYIVWFFKGRPKFNYYKAKIAKEMTDIVFDDLKE